MRKFEQSSLIQKIRTFLLSNECMMILFLLASLITVFRFEVYGALIFGFIICLILVFSDDIITTTFPFLLVSMFTIKCYDSFDTFIRFWYLVFPVLGALIFHFVYYKRKIQIGKTFWGVLAAAVAVTLGGVGKITAAEYFSFTSLYYIVGLGFGMVIIYLLMNSHFQEGKTYKLNQKFANIMVMVGLFACFMVLEHYVANWQEVIKREGVLAFQWRNNISTFLMFALPFPFYKSYKNRHVYLYCGVLMFTCLLLTGSRSAVMFGTAEYILCVLYILIYDKNHRVRNLLIFGLLTGVTLLGIGEILNFFKDTTYRFTFESGDLSIRMGLYKRAVQDFLSNPLFGRGLGYMGNRDIHKSAEFALCWYHSLPFQIIGSFGIVGVICYAFQMVIRIRVLCHDFKSRFNIAILISFIGLEMMSMVNPGEFCPIPYLLLCNLMFILTEKCSSIREKHMKNITESEVDGA